MPAYYESGFQVRKPAWHGLGHTLEDFPGREKAIELAGHNFTLVERPFYMAGDPLDLDKLTTLDAYDKPFMQLADGDLVECVGQGEGWKAITKAMPGDVTNGQLMHVSKESFTVIPNNIGWDIVEMIVGEGAKYESAGVLEQGSKCWVLAWLDEPVEIKGDNSPILPFICVSWAHDGTAALKARSTSWRVVCANTESASEAEADRTGTNFTFRHTKNYKDKIDDAKEALKGLRVAHNSFIEMARELAKIKVTKTKREEFVERFIPIPKEAIMGEVAVSDQKIANIMEAREAVRRILDGPTVPEAHKFTGYGLRMAGVEFLDHVRGNASRETRFMQTMVKPNPIKMRLTSLIKDVAGVN